MTDLSRTIAPKSDQLNSDDLINGPMTIVVRDVTQGSSPEQPISIYFDGDNGKPYKPCKSMRRVLVQLWGKDGAQYPGRAMTIYRDPDVMFGGMKVGGIRISHMTGLESPVTMALTATKASRKPFTVKPLAMPTGGRESEQGAPTPEAYIERVKGALDRADDADKLTAWWKSDKERALRESAGLSPAQSSELMQAVTARTNDLKNANSGDNGENAE
jgi:hypothetical protein